MATRQKSTRAKGSAGRRKATAESGTSEKRATKSKCTKAELEVRIRWCEDLMLQGLLDRTVARRAGDEYSVGLRQAQNYVRAVRERWAAEAGEEAPEDRRDRISRNRSRLEFLYEKAVGLAVGGDVKAIRAAESVVVRLLQLDGVLTNNAPVTVSTAITIHNPEQVEMARRVVEERRERERAQA